MYRLYQKNEVRFSLVCIIAYVVLFSVADALSGSLGFKKIITAPVCIVLVLFILVFLKKHNLSEQYGLCSFKGSLKNYLYFLPLALLASVNLWNGAAIHDSAFEIALHILSMLCVGFIEEMIFRGFLFKAMSRDNIKSAIIVSSITFGMGHIVNLLNGNDLLPTLLQLCYAAAIGFLFTIIFYKGKSLWPCIITHGVLNSLSVFTSGEPSVMLDIITAVVLCVVSFIYALWIWKNGQKEQTSMQKEDIV